jgi:hypothetical protein
MCVLVEGNGTGRKDKDLRFDVDLAISLEWDATG